MTAFKKIVNFFKHPILSASAMMVIGSNMANSLAYLYHLIFGRLLGPSEYGELAASISLLGLFVVSFTFFGTVIVKFVSAAKEKDVQKVIAWFVKKIIYPSFALGFIVLLTSSVISEFLQIDRKIIILIGFILVLSVFTLVLRSVLQGLLKFKETVIVTNVEMFGRLVFGLAFLFIGMSVFGIFLGFFLSVLVSLVITRYYLKNYKLWVLEDSFSEGKSVAKFALPILLASVATNSFFSTDIILVKHFFASHDTGLYASLSQLGKIIFFGAAPISSVMFPMVSRRHSENRSYQKIFLLSLGITITIALGVLSIYFFAPAFAIRMLYGNKYTESSPYLFQFGLFITLFTIATFLMNYYLSKGKTKPAFFAIFFAALQAIGIWVFHDSIATIISVSTVAATLFFLSLLIYFAYESKQDEPS